MKISNQVSKIVDYFRRPQGASTARVAKERLQIIIAHERGEKNDPDYLPMLQQELLAVISKYVAIDKEAIRLELQQKDDCSILELNIILPSPVVA